MGSVVSGTDGAAATGQLSNGQVSGGQTPQESEVAALIVRTLQLEQAPESIVPAAALFGDGLGLDSIDALEISLALSKTYGFELKSDDQRNGRIFASLRDLTAHIEAHRKS